MILVSCYNGSQLLGAITIVYPTYQSEQSKTVIDEVPVDA